MNIAWILFVVGKIMAIGQADGLACRR